MKRCCAWALGLATLASYGKVAASGEQYLRVSAGWESTGTTTFLDQRCDPEPPRVAYFGCIDGDDGRPIGARGDFGSGVGGELAWGMNLGPAWRAELLLGGHSGFDFHGNANFLDTGADEPVLGEVEHWRIGLRGYLDIAPAASIDLGPFDPYVGLGIHLARNEIGTMVYAFPQLPGQPALTRVPGDDWTGLGWSAVAGTAFALSEDHSLDLSLIWNDHGRVRTGADDIDVIRSGESVARVPVGPTRANLESWGVMLGWRWQID